MAFLGYSDDFDLDDDGILRDSVESGGIHIDDDGIVRDDFDLLSKHGSSTHWTDSGLGADKQVSTPSTLRQLDLQSYPSFEDISRPLDESNVNISDLEASKDDLSFDAEFNDGEDKENIQRYGKENRSGLSSRSSFDHSLNYDEHFEEGGGHKGERKQDLFGEEYYKQLQELGVLVDEDDFAQPRDSLEEFENLENHYSRDYDDNEDNVGDEIEEFLRKDIPTPTRESVDVERPTGIRNVELFESAGFDSFETRYEGKRTRPNTASSTRTISSRSFPEISPEEALELYAERLQSLDYDQDNSHMLDESQKTDANDIDDDDEIQFVASQDNEYDDDSPKPAKMPAYDNENKPSFTPQSKRPQSRSDYSDDSRSGTPQGHSQGYDTGSDRSRSMTPQADQMMTMENTGYQSTEEKIDSLTQVTRLDSRNKTHSESDTLRPDSALSELSSAASESRSARPKMNKGQGKPPKQQKNSLAHARSQESFFDHESPTPKKSDKGPKRLLPKPTPAEENQSLKTKSKSASNLNALGPVKPTHMTLSEIRNINIDDNGLPEIPDLEPKSNTSDVPKGELTKKLKMESSKRQQATQLVKQLQSDYDKLLSKYALAELTIDQMRLGAKINVYSASPTPSQATSGSLQSAQHLQMLQLTNPQRASVVSASPQQVQQSNIFFPEAQTIPEVSDVRAAQSQARGTSPALLPRSDSTNSMDSTSTPCGDVEDQGGVVNDAEQVKLGLLFQTRNLDDKMQSFQALVDDNQLTIEEQEDVFEKIRVVHEKLRREYLQSKEDYNVLRRSNPVGLDVMFDQEKELEGELFKLGMKFDEIHEKVETNIKEKAVKRQPFQPKRRASNDTNLDDSMDVDPSTENMKKKITTTSAGNDLIEPKPDKEFEKKVKRLNEEYNALMDKYRRLKQMGKTPEREQEIDNLVRKLHNICQDEPQIFKMPAEIQQATDYTTDGNLPTLETTEPKPTIQQPKRLPPTPPLPQGSDNKSDKLNAQDYTGKSEKSLAKMDKSPTKSYEILTNSESWSLAESIDRWEQSKLPASDEAKQRSKSEENLLNASMASNRSFHSDRDYGDSSQHDIPDGRLQRHDRHGSYSSISSRGRHSPDVSSHGRNSPIPSLPRPRRHDHPDRDRRERRDLKKRPEAGSTNSLQDSGISEHEGGGATGYSGPNSPLSKLPGPGKFKQMTGRRELDTDSGFIGSMVGSEVSAGNLSSRRQPPQSPLRLRHPGDSPSNQRPSSRQSSRSDDSTRVTTPRSAQSVASSRSSRRTPTKAFPLGNGQQTVETQADDIEDRTKTPTRDVRRTPTRTDSRNKSKNQKTPHRSRDYTDDSYTSVTESDMSYEPDSTRRNRPSSRNTSARNIEKIMEDSEEDRPSIKQSRQQPEQKTSTSRRSHDATKPVQKPATSSKTAALPKGKASSHNTSQSSRGRGSQMTDDDTSLTLSPTRDTTRDVTHDMTATTYTSDETTPRSVIERERKQAKQKRQQEQQIQHQEPQSEQTDLKKLSTPVAQTAPPRRVTTPVKASKSEMHPKRLPAYEGQMEVSRAGPELQSAPPPLATDQSKVTKAKYIDRSIGSLASEETILASDAETAATGATRDSVNSARLKMLSAEIDKLREEFVKANQEKAQQQQAPPPAPPIQQQQQDPYYDQYFDPTEDPLAFMRGPRRRANSFSGHGGRDWDYDWTLPNVNRDGDIPLGYAAADSYAPHRHKHKHEDAGTREEPRSRGRHRLRQRIHLRNSGTQHYAEQNGYESDQSPTRATQEVQGHYGYSGQQQQTTPLTPQEAKQTGQPMNLQQGKRVFGSQPNLSYVGYQPPPPRSTGSGSTKSSTGQTNSTGRPLRQTLYSYAANPTQNRPPPSGYGHMTNGHQTRVPFSQRPYANDDININDGRARFIPNGASDRQSGEGGLYTSACPMCGNSGYHTHGDFVYPPNDHRVPMGYLVHDGHGGTRSRTRSRSMGRTGNIRHYSPDGRVNSRYFVREFGDFDSDSAESDVEELPRRRSRSVGRRRNLKHARKYKRVRGDNDYESDRGLSRRNLSLRRTASQPDLAKGSNPRGIRRAKFPSKFKIG